MSNDFNILDHVETVEGAPKDYLILAKYHYQRVIHVPFTHVFKIVGASEYREIWPDPMAVICYMQPVPDCKERNNATARFFKQNHTRQEYLCAINENILYLTRLITDPRFLKRGLATKLLNDSLSLVTVPIVETMTPLDFTNQMYLNAGFELYPTPAPLSHARLTAAFLKVGISLTETTPPALIEERLARLSDPQTDYIENEMRLFLMRFRSADRFSNTKEKIEYILFKVPPPEAYLIWLNPTHPTAQKIREHRGKKR